MMPIAPKPRSWRSWHLLVIFALGSVVEWAGCRVREWAGGKLKKSWFPDDPDETPDD